MTYKNSNLFPHKTHHHRKFKNVNPKKAKVLKSHSADGFLHLTRNTYRIRLLNAWYEMSFSDLYFNITTTTNPAGGRLNFTIIGADSSLMAQPEYNVNSIAIASAQRYQLLFDLRNAEVGSVITLYAAGSNIDKLIQYDIKMIVDNRTNYRRPQLKYFNRRYQITNAIYKFD